MYMSNHIHTHTAQAWAEKFVSSLRHAAQASETYDSGPFSNLDEAQTLNAREVIASYKACERTGGARLLVFGLLGTLIDYAHFVNLEKMLPSVRRALEFFASILPELRPRRFEVTPSLARPVRGREAGGGRGVAVLHGVGVVALGHVHARAACTCTHCTHCTHTLPPLPGMDSTSRTWGPLLCALQHTS